MPCLLFCVVLTGFVICSTGLKHGEHGCVHDTIAERNPHIVNLAAGSRNKKRQLSDYSNIRIHPVFTNIDPTAEAQVRSANGSVSASIETLESVLMVHPVEGNLVIPPSCDEFTFGSNVGKCQSPLPPQNSYRCGDLASISTEYIGVRDVCYNSNGECFLDGPNSEGIPNADFLLFVSASSTSDCDGGTLAYASACMLDVNDDNRPVAGYINVCPSSLSHFRGQSSLIYNLILHEILHALGFSSSLFSWFIDQNGNNYDPSLTLFEPYGMAYAFTGPKTIEVAKSYYSCESIEGVLLENEGGSGTASSHWEKRTLNNEIMNGYSSSDYEVLSEFTLAFMEDTGWYKANYSALSDLNRNSLHWGRGLGCSFTTEQCTDNTVYPYLCEVTDSTMCTYDHLSKGTCSDQWSGFDGCPVALAADVTHYCRTELDTMALEVEGYGVSSICVDGVQSTSYSCGTYITKPEVPLCVPQTTYTQNNRYQYTLEIQNRSYTCSDGNAVITDDDWVVLCPPADDVASQDPVIVTDEFPELLSSSNIATDNLNNLGDLIFLIDQDVAAFGGIRFADNISVQVHINSAQIEDAPICHLFGCATCNAPVIIENGQSAVVNGDQIFSVKNRLITGTVVFTDTWVQSMDYSFLFMLNPIANYTFVYYAATVEFMDEYLQSVHSNDDNILHITALADRTVVRIAPSKGVNINGVMIENGEEHISTLNTGDTLTVLSGQDLTGSRVTSNGAVSLYSGHYCKARHDNNCSVLIVQIPPFNSWGRDFILHTNISYNDGLIGNWFKLIASDIGANVSVKCTTDGTSYASSTHLLGFRQHTVLMISHKYCAVSSDENILILQFQEGNSDATDTFMLIVPALVHYENYYVFNTFNDISIAAITVSTLNPTFNPILLNNSAVHALNWEAITLNTVRYFYTTLALSAGTHTLAFFGARNEFGVVIYGSSTNETYALPAGMRLNLTTDLPYQVPSTVEEAMLTLQGGMVSVTWTPPATPNGIIYQYIVQRINATGNFFQYVSASQHNTSLVYFSDALVRVAAINLYGQSQFVYAESKESCNPSPCINNGVCVTSMDGGSQEMFSCNCTSMFTGVYCETAAPGTNEPPTNTGTPADAESSSNTKELIIILLVTISATIIMMLFIGPLLFLHIRSRFHRRAKIVDISQVTKSTVNSKAPPSDQFVVKGNDDRSYFYINYPTQVLPSDQKIDTTNENENDSS